MYLIFDTETTGLPKKYNAPHTDLDNWPRLVQIAWQLHDEKGKLINAENLIVQPDGFTIPYNATKVHGITTKRAKQEGLPLPKVLEVFARDIEKAEALVGHNVEFDLNIMGAEFIRGEVESLMWDKKRLDTKDEATDYCAIPGGKGGKYKWPTLTELHEKLFGEAFEDAHDAAYDVAATSRCFFGLLKQKVVKPLKGVSPQEIEYEAPGLYDANFAHLKKQKKKKSATLDLDEDIDIAHVEDVPFSHLHVHSQFSILQATSEVGLIVSKAKELGMPAIAITDHGNMMAAFQFVNAALKEGIKPIVGCEFNVCHDRNDKSRQDNGYQTVLLAKNKKGYQNLAKLASYAYTEGFYYVPRIDKELLLQYKEYIIATTGGLWGEVPDLVLNVGETQAEEAFVWWKDHFGDDFFVELNRHGLEEENHVNEVLLRFAEKYGVKYFAANNTYYSKREDSKAHDILLCVKDGETIEKPKRYVGKRGREFRFGFPNDEFYLKSPEEMKALFADLPEAIETTNEIVEKIEGFQLARDVLLPKFEIPEQFKDPKDDEDPNLKNGENNYLRHLTYEGAKKRYPDITPEIQERLDFELEVIRKTGYPGYFLIVQDFTRAARDMGVSVGPGRGSAAGSAVAYCIGITNVDPIEYDLLFERFLNPDRVSMPDIDIDFDDEGRGKVIDYVIDKYGANQVAQIITYGTMAAKSSIRDTARALGLPLTEADRVAKLVPDIKLNKLFSLDDKALAGKLKNNADMINMAKELKQISGGDDLTAQTLNQARILEGSVRNTGIHACGVIITPDDITNFVPVALAKDSDMWCTQFDNSVVENAGLLKMDFLGLKTLTLIKDAVKIVKERHGIDIDPDAIPLDDEETYKLFQRGETVGIFQYESPGMQKYLRELKPSVFADLIAMNALYRPGPLEYIPSFIRRKHGQEDITYDLEDMKEYLEETYGITVYQEQVMLLSQKLAGFTKGEADMLRKAMGKKIFALLEELKPKFLNQGEERGRPKEKLEKIWKDWEAFASYAFNKSHSTCYAWVAYQTAYLKAHYPAEYMASVLSNNMNDIKQVTFFMEECRRMGIKVLGPDVNESKSKFTVNQDGGIRFGMAAIKGSGEAAVEAIIEEREENGMYSDIFDFATRVNPRQVNKKTFESLAMAGAFDCFPEYHRRQYLFAEEGDQPLIDKAVRYGQRLNADKNNAQQSLFGGENALEIPKPKVSECEPYGPTEKLNIEKEVVGVYITGHPLDQFKFEMQYFCNSKISDLKDLDGKIGHDMMVAGIVTDAAHKMTKNGKPFGILTLEDYEDHHTFYIFSDDYIKFKEFISPGWFLYLKGKVTQKSWGDQKLEYQIQDIQILGDIREKMSKRLSLFVQPDHISNDMIDKLESLAETYPGNCQLKLNLRDDVEQMEVQLLSRKYMIQPHDDLLKELEMISGVNFIV
jgi:DNA polymerase-3 subunit alpha